MMGKNDEALLKELRGHPIQDYVDTVRGVYLDVKTERETKTSHPFRPSEKRRGSERIAHPEKTEGVRAEPFNPNDYFIHRIAFSLFLKNKMS